MRQPTARIVLHRLAACLLLACCLALSTGCRLGAGNRLDATGKSATQWDGEPTAFGVAPLHPQPGPHQLIATPTGSVRVHASVRSWQAMNRENVVMQSLDYSCGSGALATILRYYFDDDIGEKDVLKAIFTRIQRSENPKAELVDRIQYGFSMGDLINAAKDLGYVAGAARVSLDQLRQTQAPVIVRIEKHGYKHFVVLRGIKGDRVFLSDPIRGNLRLSTEEFSEQWGPDTIALFLGKSGFGLPKDHPMVVHSEGAVRGELEMARQAMFPHR